MSRPEHTPRTSALPSARLGVYAKILVAILIAAAVGAGVGASGIAALASTNQTTHQLYEQNLLGLDEATALRRETLEMRVAITNQALSRDGQTMDTYEQQVRDRFSDVTAALDSYESRAVGQVRKAALKDFADGLSAYMDVVDNELIPAGRANDIDAWTRARDDHAAPQIQKMMNALGTIVDREKELAAQSIATAERDFVRNRILVIALLAVGLTLALAVGTLVARSIVHGLRRVKTVADALSTGDLTRTADLTSSDEVGQMGHALDTAVAALRDLVGSIEQESGSLASAADQLAASTTQIASTAEETSAQAGVVSAAAEQVSRNVQTVAAGTEQMGASIHEIASNASAAADVGRRAVAAAAETSATMTRLGDASREIGNVVKLITTIAEQTNLLALNATIEAARAGELGKGFAVVAGEVKELAQETGKATEDIGRRVDAIQAETGGALRAISEIGSIIDSINDYQLTIASAVEEQTATTTEINRSIGEAAAGSGEIAANIAGVAGAADLTTQGVGESRQAVGRLAAMSTELRELVGRFTV